MFYFLLREIEGGKQGRGRECEKLTTEGGRERGGKTRKKLAVCLRIVCMCLRMKWHSVIDCQSADIETDTDRCLSVCLHLLHSLLLFELKPSESVDACMHL